MFSDTHRRLKARLQRLWPMRQLHDMSADMLGRLGTVETVTIPLMKEIQRGQLINAAPVLAERHPLKRHLLEVPEAPHPVFNPGLVQVGDHYLSIVRSSSLVNFRDGHFEHNGPHDTTCYVLTINADRVVTRRAPLDDTVLRGAGSPAEYGIEDIRLFLHEGQVCGIGAGVAPGDHGKLVVTQILFELDDARISRFHVAPRPGGNHFEKNWAPLVVQERLWLNYSLVPTQFIEFQEGAFKIPPGIEAIAPHQLRNGTPFIAWGRGYMALAHTPPLWWNDRMHYLHHVVILDEHLKLVEVSSGFFFVKRGVEFACGLCRDGDMLIVSLGVGDRHALVVDVPLAVITALVMARP